jgi:hypothetical protein
MKPGDEIDALGFVFLRLKVNLACFFWGFPERSNLKDVSLAKRGCVFQIK